MTLQEWASDYIEFVAEEQGYDIEEDEVQRWIEEEASYLGRSLVTTVEAYMDHMIEPMETNGAGTRST